MTRFPQGYDGNRAVPYHHGKFPPAALDLAVLITPLTEAALAIGRYAQALHLLPNSALLLTPLQRQEAVISSRMEGTIATVDQVMIHESEEKDRPDQHNQDVSEVTACVRTLSDAQREVDNGRPISESLIRQAHATLLQAGRGAQKSPGAYKAEQNFIGDDTRKEILFIPIEPALLPAAMGDLLNFVENSPLPPLLRVGLAHVEFEALHPFYDGNGRIGRLLIPLWLYRFGVIDAPNFYASACLERNKEAYLAGMRRVSQEDDWTGWLKFFLEAIRAQADENLDTANRIFTLYEAMKQPFREASGSQWAQEAQDCLFEQPIFKPPQLAQRSKMPRHTASRICNRLFEQRLLKEIRPASGRRAALYSFEPLLEIVRV